LKDTHVAELDSTPVADPDAKPVADPDAIIQSIDYVGISIKSKRLTQIYFDNDSNLLNKNNHTVTGPMDTLNTYQIDKPTNFIFDINNMAIGLLINNKLDRF